MDTGIDGIKMIGEKHSWARGVRAHQDDLLWPVVGLWEKSQQLRNRQQRQGRASTKLGDAIDSHRNRLIQSPQDALLSTCESVQFDQTPKYGGTQL